MTKSIRLNDLQLILLSNAAQRDNGSLLPAPGKFANDADRVARAIPSLLKRLLIEEAPISDSRLSWREEDQQPIGLFITGTGRKLIAADVPDEEESAETAASAPPTATEPKSRPGSKNEQVLGMLRRPGGATMTEMVTATGWLPHSTRAVLTGLRKKGHPIVRGKRDEVTCYMIEVAA